MRIENDLKDGLSSRKGTICPDESATAQRQNSWKKKIED